MWTSYLDGPFPSLTPFSSSESSSYWILKTSSQSDSLHWKVHMIPWNRARQKLWFGSEIWLMKPLARDATRMRRLSSIDLRERQLVWRAIFPQIIALGSRPARKKIGINCLAFDLPGFGFATGFRPSLQVHIHVDYFTCRHAPVPNCRRYRRGDHA